MAKKNPATERQEALWLAWNADPTDENLVPLIKEFERDVAYKVSEFDKAPVPNAAIRSKGRQLVLEGIRTYKPEAPASLRTWVNWRLKKVRSYALQHQNFGRIPDSRGLQIGPFLQTKADLTERLGHPPDAATLSTALQEINPKYNWSVAEVTRMENELRPDLVESIPLSSDRVSQLSLYAESNERDILRYIYHDLTPQEKLVYEYTLGVNGKPKLPAKDIAKKLGVSGPKVSRLRSSIDKKMQKRGLK